MAIGVFIFISGVIIIFMGFDIIENGLISQMMELDYFYDFYGSNNIKGSELQKDFGRSIVFFGMFLGAIGGVICLYGLLFEGRKKWR